jgi:hypothetical protein
MKFMETLLGKYLAELINLVGLLTIRLQDKGGYNLEQNRIPKAGQIYRHFKDKLYQIITVATHSETREQMVVYQALYGNFKTYVRPLDMFLEEVDRGKYPEAMQKYRFELVILKEEEDNHNQQSVRNDNKPDETINKSLDLETLSTTDLTAKPAVKEESGSIDPVLLDFLEAGSYEEKLAILMHKKKYINDKILNDMAVSIDCTLDDGDIEERIMEFAFCLQTHARFENRRLR